MSERRAVSILINYSDPKLFESLNDSLQSEHRSTIKESLKKRRKSQESPSKYIHCSFILGRAYDFIDFGAS